MCLLYVENAQQCVHADSWIRTVKLAFFVALSFSRFDGESQPTHLPLRQAIRRGRLFQNMGVKNYLIEGVSCAGKTTVCNELLRRGYHTIHGDEELAYFGDLETGEPLDDSANENRSWIWDVEKVRSLASDKSHPVSFFCGGSRNSDRFLDLFDNVFILEIDLDTLNQRLAARPKDAWGGSASEGESFARLQHVTKEGLPRNAIIIDATAPLSTVVDTILDKAAH